MSMQEWMKILYWRTVPNFGKIHHLPSDEFKTQYYISPSIEEIISDLIHTLWKGRANTDKLLIGKPGCGKTTFIYYLKFIETYGRKQLSDRYHFEILHFNRVISISKESSIASIEEICLDIYKRYFYECNLDHDVDMILRNDDLNRNQKINKMIDVIKRERHVLRKQLIVFIDDIDESPIEQVESLLRLLYSYMETASIEKWLTIRGATLDHYSESLLRFIKSKFSDKIPFPRVDLFGIVDMRIKAISRRAKNPFGKELCSQLVKVFNEDIREALGSLLKFLEINKPGKTQEYVSSEWIEKYLLINFSKVLVRQRVFPNIFLHSRHAHYPLEKDIFSLLVVKPTVDNDFKRIIEHYYTNTINSLRKTKPFYGRDRVSLSEMEITGALQTLLNHQLIEQQYEKCFTITPKGRVFFKILNEPLYSKECIEELKNSGDLKYDPFWYLIDIKPSFEDEIL